MKNEFILFDFDGVIADSFQTAFEVQKMICPKMTDSVYRKRFEGNINDWEEPINVHTKECCHDINFFEEYIPRMKKEVKIFPGIKEALTELEKRYNMIVISSTITSPIKEFLKKYDLADCFVEIMGNDIHKSKVEKIKMVFEKYTNETEKFIFITDTLGDMCEAQRMKVETIGVTWGFHTTEVLLKGKPFKLVKQPKEILKAVSEYFKN